MTEIGQALARELGADRVAEDAATLAAHRTDYWILAHLRARQGRLAGGPACVVRPRSAAEVATVVRTAQRLGVRRCRKRHVVRPEREISVQIFPQPGGPAGVEEACGFGQREHDDRV